MSIFTKTTVRGAAGSDPTARPTSAAGRHTRILRLAATALAAAAAALTGLTLAAAPAHATVGALLPPADQPFGDCTVRVGTVPQTYGGAVGGTDVVCNHYRSYLAVTVALWRYNGTSWQRISSGSSTSYGNYWDSAQTADPSYLGGCASWDITASVNVDGYRTSSDYGALKGFYPRYDPTHPSTGCP